MRPTECLNPMRPAEFISASIMPFSRHSRAGGNLKATYKPDSGITISNQVGNDGTMSKDCRLQTWA